MKKEKLSIVEDIVNFLNGRNGSDDTVEDLLKRHRKNTDDNLAALSGFDRKYKATLEKLRKIESGIIPATRNQLGNVSNRYQTKAKRVLSVCSAGLLRSPTTANVLHSRLKYNTRACGSSLEFALIPISEALIAWADEIVFVNEVNLWEIKDIFEKQLKGKSIVVLDIPDSYEWNDKELQEIIFEQYTQTKPYIFGESKK